MYKEYWQIVESDKFKPSESLKSLIFSMLSKNPKHRPTIADIKAHPWYCDADIPSLEEVRNEFERREPEIRRTVNSQLIEDTKTDMEIARGKVPFQAKRVFRDLKEVEIEGQQF